MNNTFLKAEWRKLIMASYEVDSEILKPYLPSGTEIDLWNDTCYISLVGFMFLNTRVLGIKIPFHTNFEEINLRFYVRHQAAGEWRRGVVFIKEIVSKHMLSLVANTIYKEKYETMPTQHRWQTGRDKLFVEYCWEKQKQRNSVSIQSETELQEIAAGSEEEFITEHYWGYTKVNERVTAEYAVQHPRWQVYKTIDYAIDTDFGNVYGDHFAFLNNVKPKSVFMAEGSEIEVKKGHMIKY